MKLSAKFIYIFGALGGLLFGFDTGVISGAIEFIQDVMGLDALQTGSAVSGVLFGAIIGSIVIGTLSDKLGRRKLILFSALVFFVGSLLCAFSPNFIFLVAARIILGLAVGAASSLIPTYLSELAPSEKRGQISGLFQFMVIFGIFLAYITNFFFAGFPIDVNWRFMLGFAIVPSLLLFVGGIFMPESPRFLIKIGQVDKARQVMNVTYNGDTERTENNIKEIQGLLEDKQGKFTDLFKGSAKIALFIGVGLAIFQQIMGCNTVIYYAPTVLNEVNLGGMNATLLATIGIGLFNVLITAVAVLFIDRFDRKKVLAVGGIGMGLSLIVMSLSLIFFSGDDSGLRGIMCVISLTSYIVFFGGTWGPVVWIMIGEIFPLNIRGLGNSVASCVNWSANMIVSLTFPILLQLVSVDYLFVLYGALCIAAVVWVKFKVFETRGKSLEQIEKYLVARTNEQTTEAPEYAQAK